MYYYYTPETDRLSFECGTANHNHSIKVSYLRPVTKSPVANLLAVMFKHDDGVLSVLPLLRPSEMWLFSKVILA
jgi:hypothetical protein